ncbi:MAG: ComEC/Rec2 family competence protein [Ruminococcaceae bacterium]|nr:ComEC/Rec2 family competence protein [Oscillospiraceae bacterium]
MSYLIAKFGTVMLVCAFSASFFRPELSIVLAVCSLFGFFGFFFSGKKLREFSALFAAAVLGFGLVAFNLITEFYAAKALDGMTAGITGKVIDISAGSGNPVYKVKTSSVGIPGAPQEITLLLSGWDENPAGAFDEISCEVTFGTYSKGDINEFLENRSGGIFVCGYTSSPVEIIGKDSSSFEYRIHLLREKISSVIYKNYLDWHAPFMEQILIGTKGDLEDEITSLFRKSGLGHILAISGMHLVIIVGIFEKALGLIKGHKKTKKAILIFVVGIYMFIGGFGMSVLRSGFMLIAHYLSGIFFSGSKSPDNLGIAVTAVLLIDPLAACDSGFLMSVLSCLSISVFAPVLKKKTLAVLKAEEKPFAGFIAESFWVSAVAFLAVLPVSAFVFGGFSLASPFSNVFAGFFIQYSIFFGVLTVLFGFVPFLGFLAGGTAFLGMICGGILLKIAEFFGSISFFYIETPELWFKIWMFGSAVLIIFPMLYSKSFRYVRHSVLMSVFVLLAGILLDSVMFSGVAEIKISVLEHGTAFSCSKGEESVLVTKNLDSSDRYNIDFASEYEVFIGLESLSSAAEHEVLEASEPSLAFLSTEDSGADYPFAKPVSAGKIAFAENCFVEIIPDSAVTFEINGVTVLYIFEECDIMNIEPKFRRADIAVLDEVSPEDFPLLRCRYLVLRNYGGFYSGSSEIIVLKNGECQFFAYNGNLMKGRNAG